MPTDRCLFPKPLVPLPPKSTDLELLLRQSFGKNKIKATHFDHNYRERKIRQTETRTEKI
jgi:hypothetical protein